MLATSIKKILNSVLNIIIIMSLFLTIYYIYQMKILGKKYATMFNYTVFRVATGSMEDELNINDIVIIKITKDIEKNDIIAFEQDNQLIIHRAIEKTNDYITTKGDSNNQSDEPINEHQVIGKMIQKISNKELKKIIILIIFLNIIIYIIYIIRFKLKKGI